MQKANMLFLLEYGEDIEPLLPTEVYALAVKYQIDFNELELPYNGHASFFEFEAYKYAVITVLKQDHRGCYDIDSTSAGRVRIPTAAETAAIIKLMTQTSEVVLDINVGDLSDETLL